MPKTAPKKALDAIAMPSDEAIAKLIADAKEIKLDITKGSWQRKAAALKAGDLKAAK